MLIVAEGNIIQLYAAGQPGDDPFSFRYFRHCIQKRLHHIQNRFELCDCQRNGGKRYKRSGEHSVCRIEGIIIGHRDSALYCGIINRNGSKQGNSRSDYGVDFQKQRRVIGEGRRFGIETAPPGKGPFFRTGNLNFLHSGNQRIAHTVFPGFRLKLFPCDLHLQACGDKRKYQRAENDQKGRHDKRGSIGKNLKNINKRKEGGKTG